MNPHTLIKPIITEKSMMDASRGVYTFQVDLKATKHQIRQAVSSAFSVKAEKVTTTIKKSVSRRTGRKKQKTTTSATKNARVWLASGQKIDLFEFKEK